MQNGMTNEVLAREERIAKARESTISCDWKEAAGDGCE